MNKFKLTFKQKMFMADVIFWFCLGSLFLWIFLKLIGVIQTPLWLELFPLMSIGISMAVAAYKIGSFFGGLDRDIKYVKKTVNDHNHHINKYHH